MYNGFEMENKRMFKKLLIGSAFGLLLTAGTAVYAEVIIKVGPPAPIVETRPVAPGPNYVWIGGYHNYVNGAYVWVPGRWDVPPRPHARWVAHRWVRRHGGYVLVEGHWR
jgi:hypothetical protein